MESIPFNNENNSSTIKSWAVEDRPREKLLYQGVRALTNAELMAILLGSGSKNQSALALAKVILFSCENDLNELGKFNIEDLRKFKGVGPAKAVTIAAAVELGRRRKETSPKSKPKISSSRDAWKVMNPIISELEVEEFWVIYLNRSNRVIKTQMISRGGISGTVVDPRIVLQPAIHLNCSGLILAHNHPSGNLSPSHADRNLTEKLAQASKLLDISVLDHIIVGQTGYYSFMDEGLL